MRRLMLLSLLLAAACGDTTGPDPALGLARQRWLQHRPASYDVVVSRLCYCLQETIGPVVVRVRGGVVASRTYAESGQPVPAPFAALFPTVDGLFAEIDAAHARDASSVDVTYDATLGYPARIAIDYVAQMVDDEVTYTARVVVPQ